MAGEAKTSSFMLGSATVMLGPMASLFDLTPAANSIGLVKNFTMTAEASYTDLSQGVKNQIVYSVMTGNVVKASMEVYEYTSQNLAYALGLDGSGIAPMSQQTTLSTAVAGTTGSPAASIQVTSAAGLAMGDWIMIQEGTDDRATVRQITAISTNTLTLNAGIKRAIPLAGTTVFKVNAIGIGNKQDQPFLSAKVVGSLADGTEVALLIPKLRITNGFTLGFKSDGYGNLPMQFTLYDQVSTDPHFAAFQNVGQAMLATPK